MHRAPPDDPAISEQYYQKAYRQGFTTELPNSQRLQELLRSRFGGIEKCYDYYISVLNALKLNQDARIFDYGCSWGYGSWQIMQAGYQVQACEISGPRSKFARENLEVDCTSDVSVNLFRGRSSHSFDCFFSAHVLEHVPSPSRVIDLARLALRPGGFFVAFTPNGSEAYRQVDPTGWHHLWGKVHPNLIDDQFYHRAFAADPLHLQTSPADLDAVSRFASGELDASRDLVGGELLCISRI
jgi:2-polyprenyl-3-methyl-5-hydroxy-6-metoxy-1,4-benzoquinol methylase